MGLTMKQLRSKLVIAMISVGIVSVATAADDASNVSDMLKDGDVSLMFRYRYEFVDQEGISKAANASTLRSRITYKSANYEGFTVLAELDNVTVIGSENYRTPTNGNTQYPIVADPHGTDFNQASLTYKAGGFRTVMGRQRIIDSGQRFMGGVAWRQNEQTYDALRVSFANLGPVALDYGYVWNVNRIFGPKDSAVQPAHWESNSHRLIATVTPAEGHRVQAFAYLLDLENSAANSSSTYGAEYAGYVGIVSLAASLASQTDYADNPTDYSASYYMLEAGVPIDPVKISLGYEVLGSDNGVAAFRTPLATLFKFQGWADKFLNTPNVGLKDLYLKVTGKIGEAGYALIYHDFNADQGGADLGSEVDLSVSYPLVKGVSVELRYAAYQADTFATDTNKFWLTLNAKF
ncbi:MAG: hypothetical protein ACI8PP_001117 [Candidatus Pseudothioglobus sp.]|jgi:hypothetical protein